MATPNRSALLTKTHKVLKKHYKPVPPHPDRPVLEQLLFACCLEDSPYEAAEEAFARLADTFFDWNEIRVSTVKELADVMRGVHDPAAAASRLKGVLQSVFESTYSFDLETLRKQNLGHAIVKLQKLKGTTPFGVAYVTQTALGGHAIPLDRGALGVLEVVGVVTRADKAASSVPGLDRAIPKSKGVDFASLLHQIAAEFMASPFSPTLHKTLLEIAPDAKDRLPKRGRPAKKGKHEQAATAGGDHKGEPAAKKGKKEAPLHKETAPTKKGRAEGKEAAEARAAASRKPRSLPTTTKKTPPTRVKPKPR